MEYSSEEHSQSWLFVLGVLFYMFGLFLFGTGRELATENKLVVSPDWYTRVQRTDHQSLTQEYPSVRYLFTVCIKHETY